ncbi:uncharacterized protein LOC142485306 [Ascaphus truei]|uniref:uncharacterized protein LOC142485306 n=1 Tax=Ascaphus truei TaxID=8439 RepID=UPI003F5ACBC2
MARVKQVLLRLWENRLFGKLEKCQIHQASIVFLGYIISNTSLTTEPAKVKAILDWPQPTTLKAIQRFLGFSNYYLRFIQNFSSLVAPLTALTKKGADPTSLSPMAIQSFSPLKKAFVSASTLIHPYPKLPFTLEVDASDVGVGAVLSQGKSRQSRLHACAFFTKK